MAGEAAPHREPLTHTPACAFHVGRIEIDHRPRITAVGLSAEVCESFVRECINVKQLHRLAAAIDKQLAALDAKAKAKAAKLAKTAK